MVCIRTSIALLLMLLLVEASAADWNMRRSATLSTSHLPLVEASVADWNYGGRSKLGNEDTVTFFNAAGVEHPGKNKVRVWIKAVAEKSLDLHMQTQATDNEFLDDIALKYANGDIPGIFELPRIKGTYPSETALLDDIVDVMGYEVVANTPSLLSLATFYYELDCKRKRIATLLATIFDADGSVASMKEFKQIKYDPIAPDTAAEWLSLMLCPPR